MEQDPSSPTMGTRTVLIKSLASAPSSPMTRGRGHSTHLFDLTNGAVNADIHFNVLLPGSPSGPYHYHKKAENYYYLLEGSIRLIVEGEAYIVNANDAVFIPPGLKHRVEHIGSIPTKFIEVYAPAGLDSHHVEDESQNPKT
jgi:mannose-6-phosphate isomerase-like protein (cupin superfamily)